jgi:hypothetical protein
LRAPVRTQHVFEEERQNVGETGREHRGDKSFRAVAIAALGGDRPHRRMGKERLLDRRR